MKFAFYGRVSTEDQQDPTSSKQWQRSRAEAIIEPQGGVIVTEFFDIGQSRSLPWKRRPESAALLKALGDPVRGFDAVVIGEPARAFSGNQFGNTFPLFVHHGVDLWVPEIGGRIDPASDAHDLVMNLYGGMSKGERNRIKVRVRSAMSAQAHHEGRFLGGRPPYGYRLGDAGANRNPSKAADGKRLHRLEVDPTAAPVVKRIFAEYLDGKGLYAIAEGLTADGIPSPSAHDPARNRHRDHRAWGKSAVKAILMNPRYTGKQVWNRQRRNEVLIDEDDVPMGYRSKMVWNDPADWVWSTEAVHEALVSAEDYTAAQRQSEAHGHRPTSKKRRSTHTYTLSGLVHCGLCGNRMPGSWNHEAAHYRCVLMANYGKVKGLDHPKSVYIRESAIAPKLDEWLGSLFAPENLDMTCKQLAAAGEPDEGAAARQEAAHRKLEDCEQRLVKYRLALDAGADPVVVAGWMAEVKGAQLSAERELSELRSHGQMTEDEIRQLVLGLKDLPRVLAKAEPAQKAKVYAEMGVKITYEPGSRVVVAEARPACTQVRVGGGT